MLFVILKKVNYLIGIIYTYVVYTDYIRIDYFSIALDFLSPLDFTGKLGETPLHSPFRQGHLPYILIRLDRSASCETLSWRARRMLGRPSSPLRPALCNGKPLIELLGNALTFERVLQRPSPSHLWTTDRPS